MVYNGSNRIKIDDLGGFTPIFGNTHIVKLKIKTLKIIMPTFSNDHL